MMEELKDTLCTHWLSTFTIEDSNVKPIDIIQALNKENIESRPVWKPMHMQPVFAQAPAYVNGVSEKLFNKGLCIPAGPCVSDEDVAYIVDEIKKCLKDS